MVGNATKSNCSMNLKDDRLEIPTNIWNKYVSTGYTHSHFSNLNAESMILNIFSKIKPNKIVWLSDNSKIVKCVTLGVGKPDFYDRQNCP